MKSTFVAPLAALIAVVVAGPLFGPGTAQSSSLAVGTPPAYAPPPPPAYGPPSSSAIESTLNLTTTLYLPTANSAMSSVTTASDSRLGSPVGFSNTTSSPYSTSVTTISLPLTAPFTVTLSTRSSTTSLPLTGPFTVTIFTRSTSAAPFPSAQSSLLVSNNSTALGTSGSSIGSPVTAISTGSVPLHTNSTSTRTVTSTSFLTVPALSTPSLSFPSASRNGSYSSPPGTVYSTGPTGSTLVSPITASRNTTSVIYPTGTVSSTSSGTAPLPLAYSMTLSTGHSSSTGSRTGSPVTAGNTTAPTAPSTYTGYSPVSSYVPSSISTVYPNSTLVSPITASSFNPTFNSASRLPGTGSTTSSVTNLETFPSVIPDSTTFSISATSHTPSSGFGTITTAPTLVPYATNNPYPYPLTTAYEFGGPGRYPAYDSPVRGSWLGRLIRMR